MSDPETSNVDEEIMDVLKIAFINFLLELLPVFLSSTRTKVQSVIASKTNEQEIRKFLFDQNTRTFLIGRENSFSENIFSNQSNDTVENVLPSNEDNKNDNYTIFVSCDITKRFPNCAIIFLKKANLNFVDDALALSHDRENLIDAQFIAARVQIFNIGGSSELVDGPPSRSVDLNSTLEKKVHEPGASNIPVDDILNYLQCLVEPILTSNEAVSSTTSEPLVTTRIEENDILFTKQKNISEARRRLAELVASLQQVQQNSEVPFVQLSVDKSIEEYLYNLKENNVAFSPENFVESLGPRSSVVLPQMQFGVQKWNKEIQKTLRLDRDPQSGSATEEIQFWLNLEQSLTHILQQLKSEEVDATFSVLRYTNKVASTLSFEKDTGLKSKLEMVSNINLLMRDFPINDLLSARSINQLITSINQIFNHLRRLKHVTHYPFDRAFHFVEAISRDLKRQLLHILGMHRLAVIPFEEFEHIFSNCQSLSRTWEDGARGFKDMVREISRRRTIINVVPTKLQCAHTLLLTRVNDMRSIRCNHQKLKDVIHRVLCHDLRDNSQLLRDVTSAYTVFQNIDVLDVTRVGCETLEEAQKEYNDKIDRVELEITNVLRDRLGGAKTGSEIFRVFSQFNPLFFRPRIRGAVQQYQSLLVDQLNNELKNLQLQFKKTFEYSRSFDVMNAFDIPAVCGKVIWYRQIERQLQGCLQRTENVLGKSWDQHVDGKNLRLCGNDFLKKLNSQSIFDEWIQETKTVKDMNYQSQRLFNIVRLSGKEYSIALNYNTKAMFFFKECRCFTSLGIHVPYSIKFPAQDAKWAYPYLMTLQEFLHAFFFACRRLKTQELHFLSYLIAHSQHEIHELLQQGFKMTWDSENLESFTMTLCKKAYIFESKVDELESCTQNINEIIASLYTASFSDDSKAFLETHEKIQAILTQLSLQDYVNLSDYTAELNVRLATVLVKRLDDLIEAWLVEFTDWPYSGTSIIKTGSLHAFKFQSDRLSLHPSVEAARQTWINHLYQTLGYICSLPQLTTDACDNPSYTNDGSDSVYSKTDRSFRFLIQRSSKLKHAFSSVNKIIDALSNYVHKWLKYQHLWNIELSSIVAKIGDELPLWQNVLSDLRTYGRTLDLSEERQRFGPIMVDYSTAQSKVIRKFESYQHELLSMFGAKIFELTSSLLNELRLENEVLENEVESAKTLTLINKQELSEIQEATLLERVGNFLLHIMEAQKKPASWSKRIETLESSEKLLERQSYNFPSSWCWTAAVVNEWEKFQQLLQHLSNLLQQHYPQFQKFTSQRAKANNERLTALYADWGSSRPLDDSLAPSSAFQIIERFESKIKLLAEEFDKISQVKNALSSGDQSTDAMSVIYLKNDAVQSSMDLSPAIIQGEISNLRGVWTELSKLYQVIDSLKETQWTAMSPKKLRSSLTVLSESMKNIPAKYRQYEAFDRFQMKVQGFLDSNRLIVSLQSDALKDRHWKRLSDCLGLRHVGLGKLTLGDLWDAGLEKYEAEIQDVLSQAQGEMALEEFLSLLRSTWTTYEFSLSVYKNRCKLIRGWDELFTLLDDHLSSLQSMKLSPYYKVFQDDATSWDERLTRVRSLIESWVEVQRKWVYLEAVFTDSTDIQSLLPNEYSRFRSIDKDFLAIMKKTATRPRLLELVSSEGLQRSLNRLSELLSKIQKALGNYLECQRLEFPRFYFVGDEDLLEMIGNSKNIKVVQRHCGKIFAGINNFITDPENPDVLVAVASREGETVQLTTSISISSHSSLNSWLKTCEKEMSLTLANLLHSALKRLATFNRNYDDPEFFKWIEDVPCQILLLCIQIEWTGLCSTVLHPGDSDLHMSDILDRCVSLLNILSKRVLHESDKLCQLKMLQLITEVIHQRQICQSLLSSNTSKDTDFSWLQCMRFYYDSKKSVPTERVSIHMANAEFIYGFEYLGVSERLVQTPLTDKCFLTLTQALHLRLGGNPFGPAGTGKTETVKALGQQLGQFVLVFCCDEAFDFQAMGRIFVGLCQVGAWGCFDEFNRLEERILSACSEQILTIQTGLTKKRPEIELLNKTIRLNHNVSIFVTMNPGYAGRSNLPDNLKQLFREIAMVNPDKVQITEVLLYSHGFETAKELSGKVVALFDLLLQQLSTQTHYDFGLRSLKSVLSSAGMLKRQSLMNSKQMATQDNELKSSEKNILIQSICDTLVPKLVAQDIPLFRSILQSVFPNTDLFAVRDVILEEELRKLCQLRHLQCHPAWLEKVLQLNQIQKLNHGIMLVGPVGTGKTAVWTTLLEAMESADGIKGQSYVLDPKCSSKEQLYGRLDPTTMEWTDGVFTSILRKILNTLQGGLNKRYWIIFDGDVDPDWAENLNSVLDDNKLLTLPNGERLEIPSSVRLIFEVDDLRCATLATVSRCGMVWFNEDVLPTSAIITHFINELRCEGEDESYATLQYPQDPLVPSLSRSITQHPEFFEGVLNKYPSDGRNKSSVHVDTNDIFTEKKSIGSRDNDPRQVTNDVNRESRIRRMAVDILAPFFEENGLVSQCIEEAGKIPHTMEFTNIRIIESFFCLLRKAVHQLIEYVSTHNTYDNDHVEKYITRALLYSLCWGCGISMSYTCRAEFCTKIMSLCTSISTPTTLSDTETLLDYYVKVEDGEWYNWKDSVANNEIVTSQVQDANFVVETVDTLRHRNVLTAFLDEKMPFILCGPPGSGKTMTLTSTLKSLGDVDIAFLNFSSGTTSDILLKTFDHYCEYAKTASGMVLRPSEPGKWLIIFADEINLPQPDKYHTQRVIMFIRQIQQSGGFWKMIDNTTGQWSWVKVERIQFSGACNPPTDVGRHPMSNRFLRHTSVLFVEFPGEDSLRQIYGTFNSTLLKAFPALVPYVSSVTSTMVEFYTASQKKFTVHQHPHYIYSPRELTRWKLALSGAVCERDNMELDEFIRLLVHEGLRVFQDRLVDEEDRNWTDRILDNIILKNFSGCGTEVLRRPILFTSYATRYYAESSREELQALIEARLRAFNEEEINVPLVIFDQFLDHIVRASRVLKQPMGHLLLVGASGVGKTVLSKFVSWMHGLETFEIKVGRNYNTESFEADLRLVMKRAGIRGEKITFIFDESNALGPAFIERMNALLANGEVPGLFEGDDLSQLMSEMKQNYGSEVGQGGNDLFAFFTKQVQLNLHIVFTMNPDNSDFTNHHATSPALFNRCVVDWFGHWTQDAFFQVAFKLTRSVALQMKAYNFYGAENHEDDVLTKVLVQSHQSVVSWNTALKRNGKKYIYLTPRDFLDFIKHLIQLVGEKQGEKDDNAKHLNLGLSKLKETEIRVEELQESLAVKDVELQSINKQAETKMQLIVKQQAIAEERKKEAETLAADLDTKATLMSKRRLEVENELKLVEPFLREAEAAVSNIPKRNLDELRALANPPQMVKFAVEAVVVMLNNLGNNPTSWEDCRKTLKAGDFINRILTFDSINTTPSTVQRIKQKYLDTENWDVDKIMRASRAAGPLAIWVQSSIDFRIIVQKVDPLREEIAQLEEESLINAHALQETQDQIAGLENTLQDYKKEYAQLIVEVQMIKKEMEAVQNKVKRSSDLLKNLASEKLRWTTTAELSKDRVVTILGDCLLSAGFSTYLGFFEYADRTSLMSSWKALLNAQSIPFNSSLSPVDYLSKPSERHKWRSNALPADDLSMENAIILYRYIRYPLVIDPSGQANTFILNNFAQEKIISTSFMDANFFKNLEGALRFGTPLLVQDVETVDPILNSLLNLETHKTGGRTLVTVGDSEIDFSPTFKLILMTRDPTAHFSPDLCSRVTFINFTLTPSLLQNQCLNLFLKFERPDIDKKRSDLLKLQGEFQIRIRELEESLLYALSNVQGNILDNDNLIEMLETLKAQAAEVEKEAASADLVMVQVDKVSAIYLPLSEAAARIYFTLQTMHHLEFFYQFDLVFFESILDTTLQGNDELRRLEKGETSEAERLNILSKLLFKNVYLQCSIGLMYEDRIVLGLQLARIYMMIEYGHLSWESEFRLLIQSNDVSLLKDDTAHRPKMDTSYKKDYGALTSIDQEKSRDLQTDYGDSDHDQRGVTDILSILTPEQNVMLNQLTTLSKFKDLKKNIVQYPGEWMTFLNSNNPETCIPATYLGLYATDNPTQLSLSGPDSILYGANEDQYKSTGPKGSEDDLQSASYKCVQHALIAKALRPDCLVTMLIKLIESVLGANFTDIPPLSSLQLDSMISHQPKPTIPIILISSPGFDPASKVIALGNETGQKIISIAMGSEEGYILANKSVKIAAESGVWILLKNVHLSASWLQGLEKLLFKLSFHENFRIFLTMELSLKVPENLFRISFVIYFQPPVGLRASIQRAYTQFFTPSSLTDQPPYVARNRLFFLLSFLHAVILERKRYIPLGWSKQYEFSDADLQCGISIITEQLDRCSSVPTAIGSSKATAPSFLEAIDLSVLPFNAIRTLLREVVYGGRLDNEFDSRILCAFIDYLFSPEAFESNFVLAMGYERSKADEGESVPPLTAPDLSRSQLRYVEFVNNEMPTVDQPVWLGLVPQADRLISIMQGQTTLKKWRTLYDQSSEVLRDFHTTHVQKKMQSTVLVHQDTEVTPEDTSTWQTSQGWLTTIHPRVLKLLESLPPPLQPLQETEAMMNDPLFRLMNRETVKANFMLNQIESDLLTLSNLCSTNAALPNQMRTLARQIESNTLPPKAWIALAGYKASNNITLSNWILDLCYRITQLAIIGEGFGGGSVTPNDATFLNYKANFINSILGIPHHFEPKPHILWLGGLQFPSAFLNAIRQRAAQRLQVSLEELEFKIDIGAPLMDPDAFLIGGATLESASWDSNLKTLVLGDGLVDTLPLIDIQWLPRGTTQPPNTASILVPVFVDVSRNELITTVEIPIPSTDSDILKKQFYQRGVAIILWREPV